MHSQINIKQILPFQFILILLSVFTFATMVGCAGTGRDRIVLLPNKDGTPSALVVKTNKGEQVLDKPYASAEVEGNGAIKPVIKNEIMVNKNYHDVLAAQPQRPVSYILYFFSGTDVLTRESIFMLDKVKAELKSRAAPEITAIGHTDTVGKGPDNDALSLERATTMRNVLIAASISGEHFTIAGQGERELLIITADNVNEPRNRRVEINVR